MCDVGRTALFFFFFLLIRSHSRLGFPSLGARRHRSLWVHSKAASQITPVASVTEQIVLHCHLVRGSLGKRAKWKDVAPVTEACFIVVIDSIRRKYLWRESFCIPVSVLLVSHPSPLADDSQPCQCRCR